MHLRALSARGFAAAVAISLAAKVLFARHLALGHAGGTGLVTDVAFVAASVLGVLAVSRGAGRWAPLAADALVSVALAVTVVYTRYFDQVPGLALARMAGQATELGDSIADLLAASDALFLVDLPLLALLAARVTVATPVTSRTSRIITIGGALLATGLFAVGIASAVSGPWPVDSRSASFANGMFAYQVSTLVPRTADAVAISPAGPAGRKVGLQATIDELTRRRDLGRVPGAPAPGTLKGANVIMVQVEALQTGLVGARIDGQPVVPNIESFAAEGWYFPNTISQIGKANTADAEFVANTSLYPALEEPTPLAYAGKRIPSLPRLLKEAGYDTFTMHTNDVTFWNRDRLYPALGFDRYYDDDFFGREDVTGHGASDRVLYERALPVLREAAAEGPFYAHLVTISAHHPFTGAADRGALKLAPRLADTPTGRYLRSQSYADAEVGRFLDALRRDGLLDQSIVVIYGDHFGLRLPASSPEEAALRRRVFGHEYNRADMYTSPLIVRLPRQARGATVAHVLGQVDILPTVADLLGIDISRQPHFGRSAFERTPTLLTKGGSLDLYVDDELIYVADLVDSEDLAFSATTRLPVESARPAGLEDTARLLSISAAYCEALPPSDD